MLDREKVPSPLLEIPDAPFPTPASAVRKTQHARHSERSPIGNQVCGKNAAPSARVEVRRARAFGRGIESVAARYLLCDRCRTAAGRDGGGAFLHAGGDWRGSS